MHGYNYELVYRPGTSTANAHALSRLPLKETVEVLVLEPVLNLLQHLGEGPVTASMIKEATKTDPVMSLVLQYVSVTAAAREEHSCRNDAILQAKT